MPLVALLAAPRDRTPLPDRFAAKFAGEYCLGWLFEAGAGARWMTWGSCNDKPAALEAMEETLDKHGRNREVLVWDEPLPVNLTTDQVAAIRAGQTATGVTSDAG